MKKILFALLSEQRLTDESLETLLTEVEYILNSRPLTPVVMDSKCQEPITPNHLLLAGHEGASLPPGVFCAADSDVRKRWKQVQYMADQFWRRWTKEYLQTLQVRQKWRDVRENLAVDDVVLLYDEHLPRRKWQLGRVTQVFPDANGKVRQVQVKTGSSSLCRPVPSFATQTCPFNASKDFAFVSKATDRTAIFVNYCVFNCFLPMFRFPPIDLLAN